MVVVHHPAPLMALHRALWNGSILAQIQCHVLRIYPLLNLAHLGVLPAPTEQPGGLHAEVAQLVTTGK